MKQPQVQLDQWSAALLTLQQNIGSDQFYPSLHTLLQQVCAFDEILVLGFAPTQAAQLIWQKKRIDGDNLDLYLNSAFVLDPFYRLGFDKKQSGFFSLAEIMPADSGQYEDYYNRYFRHLKIIDEVGFIFQLGGNLGFVHIELANFTGSKKISSDCLQLLKQLSPILQPLITQHQLSYINENDADELNFVEQFHQKFGTEVCTAREHDVMLLMLQGYSVKAVAHHLGLGVETIKMHKKNIYAKLEVSSQPELLALFIDLLVMAEAPIACDPLMAHVKKLRAA